MELPEGLITYVWVGLCSVLAPAMFGVGLLRWLGLGPTHGLRLSWGLGYVVGHYVLAHAVLLWLVADQPGPGWPLPVAAAGIGLWLTRRARHRAPPLRPRPRPPWTSWLPVALLSLFLVHTFLAANAEPVRYSDEAVNWATKAKVLYTAPGFDLKTGLDFFVEHPDYPIFNPLAQVLAFASAGRVLHFENRLPVQFFAVALLLILSAATTRRSHPLAAVLALVTFTGTSFLTQAPSAYADVMLACAALATGEALLRWREDGDRVFIAVAMLCSGAMISIKNEGQLLVAAIVLPFALDEIVTRWRTGSFRIAWRTLPWLGVPVAALALHRGINAWFSVQNDLTNPTLAQGRGMVTRIVEQLDGYGPQVLGYYGRMLIDPAMHRLLPLAFLVIAPIAWRIRGRAWLTGAGAPMALAFVGATAGYMLVFVSTIYDLRWHLDVAADRTMLHVLPLVVVGLAASAWPRQVPTPPS